MIQRVGVIDLPFSQAGEVQNAAVHRVLCPPRPPVGVMRVARAGRRVRQGRGFPHLPPNLTLANMDGAAVPLAGLWGRVPSCRQRWELLESPGHAGSFPTDAVAVPVARSPSNGEWPLQILERPAGGEGR